MIVQKPINRLKYQWQASMVGLLVCLTLLCSHYTTPPPPDDNITPLLSLILHPSNAYTPHGNTLEFGFREVSRIVTWGCEKFS